ARTGKTGSPSVQLSRLEGPDQRSRSFCGNAGDYWANDHPGQRRRKSRGSHVGPNLGPHAGRSNFRSHSLVAVSCGGTLAEEIRLQIPAVKVAKECDVF